MENLGSTNYIQRSNSNEKLIQKTDDGNDLSG